MERKPLKSVQMSTGTRVYYFDAFKDSSNKHYIVISEIATDSNPGKKKKRGKVFVHSHNLIKFMDAMQGILDYVKNESPDV